MFTDPTGHSEKGDKNLAKADQKRLIKLGQDYAAAQKKGNTAAMDAAHRAAAAIRDSAYDGKYVDTYKYHTKEPNQNPNGSYGIGSSGDTVEKIQTTLVNKGYSVGDSGINHDGIDSTYGRDTKAAVVRYQIDHNLKYDGVVGENTAKRLGIKLGSEDKGTSKNSKSSTITNVENKPVWERNTGWYWRADGLLQTPDGVVPVGSQWAINNGYYWNKDGSYQTPDGVMPPPQNGQLSEEATKNINAALKVIEQENKNEEKLNLIQSGLDVAGMIPVIGEPIDGVNAAIYWARGDQVNAALSAGSMLPIAGWVTEGGKLVKKSINVLAKYGDDALEGIEIAGKEVDNVVEDIAKTQIVVNHEVGNMFDVYVEGTKLKGVAKHGLVQTQEIFVVDKASRYVKPDYSIYNKNGDLMAIGDAKSGAITYDDQFRGFVELASKSDSKTLIYYTPLGNTLASMTNSTRSALKTYAKQFEVEIIEIGVK